MIKKCDDSCCKVKKCDILYRKDRYFRTEKRGSHDRGDAENFAEDQGGLPLLSRELCAHRRPASEGIVFGYCNRVGKKSVVKKLKPGEFKFDGKYHWYRIGVVDLSADCCAFAHKGWEMQRTLMDLLGSAPRDRVELFIRLKAEPDAASPDKIAKLWMDGVAAFEPLPAAPEKKAK